MSILQSRVQQVEVCIKFKFSAVGTTKLMSVYLIFTWGNFQKVTLTFISWKLFLKKVPCGSYILIGHGWVAYVIKRQKINREQKYPSMVVESPRPPPQALACEPCLVRTCASLLVGAQAWAVRGNCTPPTHTLTKAPLGRWLSQLSNSPFALGSHYPSDRLSHQRGLHVTPDPAELPQL